MHSAVTATSPRLAYRVVGTEGEPVLFIMGFAMVGGVWTPLVNALRGEFRCCHYDHLGLGRSEPSPAFPTVASMADDAVRVLDDLGWDRVHVVGLSMGGMIAQEIGLRHPGRCSTLTLIATHAGGWMASFPAARGAGLVARGVLGGPKVRFRLLPKLLYHRRYLERVDGDVFDPQMRERLRVEPPLRTVASQLLAVQRHRTEARLHRLSMPVLLVRPGRDILVNPSHTDRLAARIPRAQVVRYDDAGHGVTLQKGRELASVLRSHFRGEPGSDGATPSASVA
ncbi:MAG: alpha/beta hydrolase [Myxococcota bacterium]